MLVVGSSCFCLGLVPCCFHFGSSLAPAWFWLFGAWLQLAAPWLQSGFTLCVGLVFKLTPLWFQLGFNLYMFVLSLAQVWLHAGSSLWCLASTCSSIDCFLWTSSCRQQPQHSGIRQAGSKYLSLPSQCSLHNAPIFRLLLKVAVNGTHQCESLNFCGTHVPTNALPGKCMFTSSLHAP